MSKEVGAGGRFDIFLDSECRPKRTQILLQARSLRGVLRAASWLKLKADRICPLCKFSKENCKTAHKIQRCCVEELNPGCKWAYFWSKMR